MRRDEIAKRVAAVPGGWSIEEHGKGYALYSGRDENHHGLNLLHLSEPDHRWPEVRALLESAHQDLLWLVQENERLQAKVERLESALDRAFEE